MMMAEDGTTMAQLELRQNISALSVALIMVCLLIALKAWGWWQTGSLSIASSLADSALDLLASTANLAALIYAARPADEDHPFGHSSAEDLATLGQALIVLISGVMIGVRAIERLLAPQPLQAADAGLSIMLLTLGLTGLLVLWLRLVARRTKSSVVAADALHYLSDLLPIGASLIALAAARWLSVHWLDPLLALLAAGFLLQGAWRLGLPAFHALMDREIEAEHIARLRQLADDFPGVHGWHDLKTRAAGGQRFIQIHLELDGHQTLFQAHDIARDFKRAVLASVPRADVIVHMDPAQR